MNKGRISFISVILVIFLIVLVLACGSSESNSSEGVAKESESQAENTSTITQPTPEPTATINPNIIKTGTYLVGSDIKPGLYRGIVGTDILDSCYWARMKDLSGDLDSILANDNAIGQFFVEVAESDYAFEIQCEVEYLETLPVPVDTFPTTLIPGEYLVGRDIQPGLYQGKAGEDVMESCYWARLKDFSGELGAILANDNATGQFYVEIQESDFGFRTGCNLEFKP